MKNALRTTSLSLALAVASTGLAYADWPSKPITITAGYGAGGLVDAMSRVVSDIMSDDLGQPVIVENRPGAGGGVASAWLLQQPADGYNIVATTSATLTLDPQVTELGFDVNDFTYIAAIGEFYDGFFALPERGWQTIDDALEAAASEGQLEYASVMTIDRLLTGFLGREQGATLVPMPTAGGADAITQVLGGHAAFGFNTGSYMPYALDGELTVLALSGSERHPDLPDVPTLLDLGYDVSAVSMIFFVAPKGIPEDVRDSLVDAFSAAAEHPRVLELIETRGLRDTRIFGAELQDAALSHWEANSILIQSAGN